jgi:UPF0755 protein
LTDTPVEQTVEQPADQPADEPMVDDDGIVYLPPERSRLRRVAPVIGTIVGVAVLALVLGGVWVARQVNPPNAPGKAVTVAIPDGSSDSKIASVLAAHGVVTNADVFRYYVKLTSAGPFKSGLYDHLHTPEAMADVVKRLNQAALPPPTRTVVIPEGLWLSEVRAKILQTYPEMKPADLDKALATVHSKYQPAGSTNLEGFLFPATYQVLLTDVGNPQKLVAQMVTKFDEEADSLGLNAGAKKLGLTPYQVLTVASMVEEEAKVPGDRPKIARVILNRLGKGMTLGLDTTVEYALQQRVVNITNRQLATPSPYNTRLHAGLPPTPISSPGRASLEAALNPAPGDWLYFVLAAKDGSQYFTSSYSDFQRATAKARAEGLFGG